MLVDTIAASLGDLSADKGSYKGNTFVTQVSFVTAVGAIKQSATLCPITCVQYYFSVVHLVYEHQGDAHVCVQNMHACSASRCLPTPGQWLFFSYLPVALNEDNDMFMVLYR